jgi:hypothetical protein
VIALTDEGREAILDRIRRRRLEEGQPSDSDEWIAREVIASQRIEGVDARPWIPRR